MIPQLSRKERAEHLYRVITSERFLTKQGLGNEVPFFICPFPAEEGGTMIEDRRDLIERIAHAGVTALDLSLYEISLGLLEERGILEDVLAADRSNVRPGSRGGEYEARPYDTWSLPADAWARGIWRSRQAWARNRSLRHQHRQGSPDSDTVGGRDLHRGTGSRAWAS